MRRQRMNTTKQRNLLPDAPEHCRPGSAVYEARQRTMAADLQAAQASGRLNKLAQEADDYETTIHSAVPKCLGGDPGAVAAAHAGLKVLEPFLNRARAEVR